MAISKRTRYEVLRRCNFACYYCGIPAPIVQLQIDHVVPRAHGGTDDPWNLVSACRDCNLGKTDGPPTDEMLERVRSDYYAYVSATDRRNRVEICQHCGVPVLIEPGDDFYNDCIRCNKLLCMGYDAGLADGRKGAR